MVLRLPELRVYRCDFGHEWSVRVDSAEPELVAHTFCSEGHEAITRVTMPPVDAVQVLIRPAAVVSDRVRGTMRFEEQYRLTLLDRDGAVILDSSSVFPWEAVVRLATVFRQKSESEARELWQRRGL